MNSLAMDPAKDIGGDGLSGSTNQFVAEDAYGFNLNYYTGDYSATNSGVLPFPGYMAYLPAGAYRPALQRQYQQHGRSGGTS